MFQVQLFGQILATLTSSSPAFWSYPSHVYSDASQWGSVSPDSLIRGRLSWYTPSCIFPPTSLNLPWLPRAPSSLQREGELQQMLWVKEMSDPAGIPLLPHVPGCSQIILKPTLLKLWWEKGRQSWQYPKKFHLLLCDPAWRDIPCPPLRTQLAIHQQAAQLGAS